MFRLRDTIARDANADPGDVRRVKAALGRLGFYDAPDGGTRPALPASQWRRRGGQYEVFEGGGWTPMPTPGSFEEIVLLPRGSWYVNPTHDRPRRKN